MGDTGSLDSNGFGVINGVDYGESKGFRERGVRRLSMVAWTRAFQRDQI